MVTNGPFQNLSLIHIFHEVFADLDVIFQYMRAPSSKFQSTRSSQTSTSPKFVGLYDDGISIHEVFADLDRGYSQFFYILRGFQSTRSSQTSTQLSIY